MDDSHACCDCKRRAERFARQRRQDEAIFRARLLDEMSDSSDDNALADKVKTLKVTPVLTPNGSSPAAETDAKPAEVLDPALIGMSVGLKNLYSGKEDKRGRFQWQAIIPENVGTPVEDAETQKWALIIRHVKVYNNPSKVLAIHSIVIQSPPLKKLLEEVMAGYPGVTAGLERLEFTGKFEPLIHRWTELKAAIDKLKALESEGDRFVDLESGTQILNTRSAESENYVKLKHAELLYDLLSTEFKSLIESSQDMKANGVMTYEHLLALFQPGSLVYSRQEGQDRIFKLIYAEYGVDQEGKPVLWIAMQYVDFDGVRFGSNKLNVCIHAYAGTKPISSLASSPLEFHPTKEELKAKLMERGAKVESFAGSHFRAYEGVGWRHGHHGVKDKMSINGRIVIDTHGWNLHDPNTAIYVTSLQQKDHTTTHATGMTSGIGTSHSMGSRDSLWYDESAELDVDGMPNEGYLAQDDVQTQRQPLTDEQKLVCTHLLRGYALKEKIWLNLFVNSVKDIMFNSRAFDSLVLPESQKELILGFTASQQSSRNAFDDVIEGKGRGIILLLCGPPGVGKTLTAESVAEEMKVPLYTMSAGDLGLNSQKIETTLQGVFDMVTRWNAILLLDEADVFLEERSLHDLERNRIVGIFLRVLEYYEGIMFLTTNRVSTFDAAFQSRIHISLDYPELSIDSRRTVWKNFLRQHDVVQAATRERPLTSPVSSIKAAGQAENDAVPEPDDEQAGAKHLAATLPHAITDRQIDSLALMHMNGRQIKNVLKTGQLLASRRGEGLSKEHITKVLDVTQHLHNATRENERTKSSIFS